MNLRHANKFKVLIISCWILLVLAVIAKLCGADIFKAGTDNERFKAFCDYTQNSFWYYVIASTVSITTSGIYYMAVLKSTKLNLLWVIPLVKHQDTTKLLQQ